jgi:hypothetical protein
MLTLLGARPRDLETIEPSDGDWYANLLWLDGRKCLLLAHAGTLFSVFVPDIRKAELVPIGPSVVRFIHKELRPRASRSAVWALSIPAPSLWRKRRAALCWAT